MKPKKINREGLHAKYEARERVDWLTPKGKVIGTIDKKFAHTHGLFHAAAHVYILDAKNNIIFQKRGKWMLLQPGKWDTSSGGHVTAGETPLDAAVRESREEMNARGTIRALGQTDIFDRGKNYENRERISYFVMKSKTPIRFQKSEVEKIARVPFEKVDAFLRTHNHTPWLATSWKKYRKKIMAACKLKK